MSNQTYVQKAIEIVTKATEEDKNENFEEAFKVSMTKTPIGYYSIVCFSCINTASNIFYMLSSMRLNLKDQKLQSEINAKRYNFTSSF